MKTDDEISYNRLTIHRFDCINFFSFGITDFDSSAESANSLEFDPFISVSGETPQTGREKAKYHPHLFFLSK